MFENLAHNILVPYEFISNDKQWIIRKQSWCLYWYVEVVSCYLNVFDSFPSWGARAGYSEGCGCYHCGLCHFSISGTTLPRCPRAVGGAQALLLSPQCVWGEAGKILKTSALIREVSQWGTQEEKCMNPCFSLDLCYLHVGLTKGPLWIWGFGPFLETTCV